MAKANRFEKKEEVVTENNDSTAVTEVGAEGPEDNKTVITAEGTEPAGKVGKAGGKQIILTLEDGTTIPRSQYIKDLWAARTHTRADIAKELSKLQGIVVPYQIVFAATKNLEGGKPVEKKVKAVATPAVAAEGEVSTSTDSTEVAGEGETA